MRKLVVLLAGLVIASSCSPRLETPEGRYAAAVRARAYFENGDTKRAGALLDRLADASRDPVAYENLGIVRFRAGKRESAEAAWLRATIADRGRARAHFWLGVSRRERSQELLKQASAEPGKAEKLRDSATEAMRAAQQALEAAAAADPTEPLVQQVLALVHQDLGQKDGAARATAEARRLDPAGLCSLESSGYARLELPPRPNATTGGWVPMRFSTQAVPVRATGLLAAGIETDARSELVLLGDSVAVRCDSTPDGPVWSQQDLAFQGAATTAVLADLEGDGRSDLVVFTPTEVGVRAWRAGGARAPVAIADLEHAVEAAHVADVDADGDLDLLVAAPVSPGLRILRNDSGRFALDAGEAGIDKLPPLLDFACADFTGDLRPDLVCVDRSGRLRILVRRTSGGFADVSAFAGLAMERARVVTAADMDADGAIDLVLGNDAGLWVYANRGAARFVRSAAYRPAQTHYGSGLQPTVPVTSVLVLDLDNDGLPDVLTVHPRDGIANPEAMLARTKPSAPSTADGTTSMEDTAPEMPLPVLESVSALRAWRNDGHGVLLDTTEKLELAGETLLDAPPASGDFDGDGDLDLACTRSDSTLLVHWNDGGNANRRLLTSFAGGRGARDAVGARFEVHSGAVVQSFEVVLQPVWLGVQQTELLDLVRIAWPDGTIENRFAVPVPANGSLVLSRGAPAPTR